jgi:hypothetical protein
VDNPLETAINVAIPEFDGRIITVPHPSRNARRKEPSWLHPAPGPDGAGGGLAARIVQLRGGPTPAAHRIRPRKLVRKAAGGKYRGTGRARRVS